MAMGGEEKKKRILPNWIRGGAKRTDRWRRHGIGEGRNSGRVKGKKGEGGGEEVEVGGGGSPIGAGVRATGASSPAALAFGFTKSGVKQ